MENTDNEEKESMFKDFFKRPCMRTAFMYGIGGGLGTGMAVFLFTSRVKRSADVGVSAFAAITLLSLYDRAKMKLKQRRYMDLQKIETKEV